LLGGSGNESRANLAIDAAGNVYLTGQTLSTDFPIRGAAFQSTKPSPGVFPHDNGFLSIFTATGDLVYSSYFGGTGPDSPHAIALDAFGSIYIAGETSSSDFPIVNAIQPTMGSTNSPDGFVLKFNKTATALLY